MAVPSRFAYGTAVWVEPQTDYASAPGSQAQGVLPHQTTYGVKVSEWEAGRPGRVPGPEWSSPIRPQTCCGSSPIRRPTSGRAGAAARSALIRRASAWRSCHRSSVVGQDEPVRG